MGKGSFVFYESWLNVISDLPEDVQLEVYQATAEYAIRGNLTELKPMAKVAFAFIKQDIDRDAEKYMSIVERNRKNGQLGAKYGKLGGRPKKEKPPKTPHGVLKTPKTPDNDNDNDNVSTIVDNKKENKIKEKGDELKKSIEPYLQKYGREMCNKFFLYWSEPNKSKTKLRFEFEKTWDVSRRLALWSSRSNSFKKEHSGAAKVSETKYEQF